MDHEPFDSDLFDPPPKQHKQQSSLGAQSPYQQPYAKQQQRQQASTSYVSAKNAAGHTNLPGGLSGEIRAKTSHTDITASNSGGSGGSAGASRSRSPYAEFQYSPKSLPVSHIVQSGSYVEILKQGGAVQRQPADISPTHQNPNREKRHHRSIAACHNKSYGDFLTITPRRKGGKLLPSAYDKEQTTGAEALDGYHHRKNLPHSIEPLHLLGLSNEKNYTFLDYRAMEAISNADTLEMGTSLAGGNIKNKRATDRYNEQSNSAGANMKKQSIAEVSSEYQYFIREKNLSPPSAFSDNILSKKT